MQNISIINHTPKRARSFAKSIGVFLSAIFIVTNVSSTTLEQGESAEIRFLKEPVKVADFEFRDHANRKFDRKRLLGHWTIIYFGYLNCPDICPLTMSVLQNVWQAHPELQTQPEATQVVLVSVDPDRDSVDKLAAYVQYFNPDFIGVTGTDAMLERFTKNIGSVYAFEDDPRDDDNYIVQHTTDLFLLDPRGHVVARLPEPHYPQSIYQALQTATAK
jgi:protein SCO1/2